MRPLSRSTGALEPRTDLSRARARSLSLLIKPCANYRSKVSVLAPFLRTRGKGAAIVYVTVQKHADDLARELKESYQVDARSYHAGMTADTRKEVQEWFIGGSGVVVATIACVLLSLPLPLSLSLRLFLPPSPSSSPSPSLFSPRSSSLPLLPPTASHTLARTPST